MHTLNFSFFSFTKIIRDTQSVISTGLINLAFNNLSNSALTNNYSCGFILLFFCVIGLASGINEMQCSTISLGICLISSYDQAKASLNSSRNSAYSLISYFSYLVLIFICLTLSFLVVTFTYF